MERGWLGGGNTARNTTIVRSNYLSIAHDGYVRRGSRDPLRAVASRYVTMSEQMHIPGLGVEWALHEARTRGWIG